MEVKKFFPIYKHLLETSSFNMRFKEYLNEKYNFKDSADILNHFFKEQAQETFGDVYILLEARF